MNIRLIKLSSLAALAALALAGCGSPSALSSATSPTSETVTAQGKGRLAARAEWYSGANDTETLAVGVGGKTLFGNFITDQGGGTPIRINDKEVARGSLFPTPEGKIYLRDSASKPAKYYYMGKVNVRNLTEIKFGTALDVEWAMGVDHFAEEKGLNPMTKTSFFHLILSKLPEAVTTQPATITRPYRYDPK